MTEPLPDPGNADPEDFTEELTENERDIAYGAVNQVATSLPEPAETQEDV